MHDFEIILALLVVAALVQPVARRLDIPLAIAQVVCGIVLSVIPLFHELNFDPELTFTLFVPPLLFWAAVLRTKLDLEEIEHVAGHADQTTEDLVREIGQELREAARRAVVQLRDPNAIGQEALRRVQYDLDLDEVRNFDELVTCLPTPPKREN